MTRRCVSDTKSFALHVHLIRSKVLTVGKNRRKTQTPETKTKKAFKTEFRDVWRRLSLKCREAQAYFIASKEGFISGQTSENTCIMYYKCMRVICTMIHWPYNVRQYTVPGDRTYCSPSSLANMANNDVDPRPEMPRPRLETSLS